VPQSVVEDAAVSWCGELGYSLLNGGLVAPRSHTAECAVIAELELVLTNEISISTPNLTARPQPCRGNSFASQE